MATWSKQLENRNFLSPIGFKFSLARFPKVSYFCQSANIPAINLGIVEQPAPLRNLPLEAFNTYDPLNLTFLIDEDLENYLILHNWIRALGTPDSVTERKDYRIYMDELFGNNDLYTDATLTVLNSNFNMNVNVVFKDLMPTGLSALDFNATIDGTEYAVAQASFRYLSYEIRGGTGVRDKRLS